jgi:cytochrome P450
MSTRVSSVGMISLMRKVVNEGGVDLGNDMHIPKGVRMAVPAVGIHGDSNYYEHPNEFDAFRFARSR